MACNRFVGVIGTSITVTAYSRTQSEPDIDNLKF
jgi:hypothetical protein